MDKETKRGRPAFKPTAAMRQQVEISVAFGMAHSDIALALGIERKTLVKHFDHEISVGAAKRRMAVLVAMNRVALKGNVSAQKALLSTTSTATVPKPDEDGAPAATPSPTPAPAAAPAPVMPGVKLGKKEAAQAAAVTAAEGTEWEHLLKPGAPLQ